MVAAATAAATMETTVGGETAFGARWACRCWVYGEVAGAVTMAEAPGATVSHPCLDLCFVCEKGALFPVSRGV